MDSENDYIGEPCMSRQTLKRLFLMEKVTVNSFFLCHRRREWLYESDDDDNDDDDTAMGESNGWSWIGQAEYRRALLVFFIYFFMTSMVDILKADLLCTW